MEMEVEKQNIDLPSPFKGFESFNEFRSSINDNFIKRQPSSVRSSLENIKDTVEKYKGPLDEIENALLEYQKLVIIQNPTVYVARTKDVRTEIEYFTAKTSWPMKGGKKKEVKIYLGKASDYDNDTKSKKAKIQATAKMKQTLLRRSKEGSLDVS
jgi:hypothetical protein